MSDKYYRVSEEFLKEILEYSEEYGMAQLKKVKEILDMGPLPDMNDDAMHKAFEEVTKIKYWAGSGDGREGWNACWEYLRGDK